MLILALFIMAQIPQSLVAYSCSSILYDNEKDWTQCVEKIHRHNVEQKTDPSRSGQRWHRCVPYGETDPAVHTWWTCLNIGCSSTGSLLKQKDIVLLSPTWNHGNYFMWSIPWFYQPPIVANNGDGIQVNSLSCRISFSLSLGRKCSLVVPLSILR